MSIKLALDISKCDVPKVFKDTIKEIIPKEHLMSHSYGMHVRIFEEFIYDILRTFQNDISIIFIDDISKDNLSLAQDIKRYAIEHNFECFSKEDGEVSFTLLPNDSKVFIEYAESYILHDKIEGDTSLKYLLIPIEAVAHANRGVKETSIWKSDSLYKQAFKEILEFLNGYISADI